MPANSVHYGRRILADRKWREIEDRAEAASRRLIFLFVEAAVVFTLFAWVGIEICSGAGLFIPK
jgi:hypothetical protein